MAGQQGGAGGQAEWSARARSFGSVAEAYDRYRPGYPDALLDDVLALAPGRRVLEAGAGTGRATLELVRRGARVVAVEPDPAMAEVARRRLAGLTGHTGAGPGGDADVDAGGGGVDVREARFEDHDAPDRAFDLVVAAQAWHWVDPEGGPAAAARALVDGGVLAVWWNRPRDPSGPVWDAIHAVYAEHAPGLAHSSRAHTHTHSHAEDTVAAPGFTAWTRRTYAWSAPYDAETYCAMVATHSDHIRLPDAQRARLLEAVHDAIVGAGGRLDYEFRTLLLHARTDRTRATA